MIRVKLKQYLHLSLEFLHFRETSSEFGVFDLITDWGCCHGNNPRVLILANSNRVSGQDRHSVFPERFESSKVVGIALEPFHD